VIDSDNNFLTESSTLDTTGEESKVITLDNGQRIDVGGDLDNNDTNG
jgi:hypothetical protein